MSNPLSPKSLRALIRANELTQPTAGLAPGFVQVNVVMLPEQYADDFTQFCQRNNQACPLIFKTKPGQYRLPDNIAAEADLRTDISSYKIFRYGIAEKNEPSDIIDAWQNDFVTFLIGCSFTVEHALIQSGFSIKHIEQHCNVSMYETSIPCQPAGVFSSPLVVSMRPFKKNQINEVVRITSHYPEMHGAPVHIGDPLKIGIQDIHKPDFGDSIQLESDDIPVFWACGVTPQLALTSAKMPRAITHSPGHMLIIDLTDTEFAIDRKT